jgi:hypothetical protein
MLMIVLVCHNKQAVSSVTECVFFFRSHDVDLVDSVRE